jgi:hypothetical protein
VLLVKRVRIIYTLGKELKVNEKEVSLICFSPENKGHDFITYSRSRLRFKGV